MLQTWRQVVYEEPFLPNKKWRVGGNQRELLIIYAPPVDLRAVCLVRAICQNQVVAEALVVLKRLKVVVGDQEVCGRSLNQCLPFKPEFMIAE